MLSRRGADWAFGVNKKNDEGMAAAPARDFKVLKRGIPAPAA